MGYENAPIVDPLAVSNPFCLDVSKTWDTITSRLSSVKPCQSLLPYRLQVRFAWDTKNTSAEVVAAVCVVGCWRLCDLCYVLLVGVVVSHFPRGVKQSRNRKRHSSRTFWQLFCPGLPPTLRVQPSYWLSEWRSALLPLHEEKEKATYLRWFGHPLLCMCLGAHPPCLVRLKGAEELPSFRDACRLSSRPVYFFHFLPSSSSPTAY